MSTPPFIDVAYAADMLHVSPDLVLDWTASGRLKTYCGRSGNPFVRTPEVLALAAELGVGTVGEPPKRMKSAAGKVQTRLTSDSKWGDLTEEEIWEWARRADVTRRQAARAAVRTAQDRLRMVLDALDGLDGLP
ncbi:MAG: hypothetical protein NVS4B2_06890 [Chloroflexota bacterium]